MKKLIAATREEVYSAPIINWNNGTYTPVSNQSIMDQMDEQMYNLGLTIQSEHYKVARDIQGNIRGVIGGYDIMAGSTEFAQRVMFRNSYDKSMSFAFAAGLTVMICSNGCVSGDFQYKRVHRGALTETSTTTAIEVRDNILGGFDVAQKAFEHNKHQLENMQEIKVDEKAIYEILGILFFEKKVLNISQMSIINKELQSSKNFRHLGDPEFTAWDVYNHITESLKTSHPLTYFNDHIQTHTLFENTFGL